MLQSPVSVRAFVGVALLLAGSVAAAPKKKKDAPVEAPPMLVSTEGGAGAWTSVKELIAAAEKGNALACFQYAQLLEAGDQVPKDDARALTFYQRAADGDHGEALFRLGKIHHDGLLGVSVDYADAMLYYRRAAAAGVAEATYNIGAMYVSGRGVKRDYVEGLAWLLVAAERGAEAQAGVQQVKQRLAKRPEQIAAAERRALSLVDEIARGETAPATPATGALPRPTPSPARPTAPVVVEPAGPAAATRPAVKIEQPAIAIPPPKKP